VTLKVSGGLEVTPLKTFGTNLQQALSRHVASQAANRWSSSSDLC
jgi:hypothetical protein